MVLYLYMTLQIKQKNERHLSDNLSRILTKWEITVEDKLWEN